MFSVNVQMGQCLIGVGQVGSNAALVRLSQRYCSTRVDEAKMCVGAKLVGLKIHHVVSYL